MIWQHNIAANTDQKGIYYLRNTSTGKIYIGCTTRSFKARWTEHINDLRDNTHHNSTMQADYNTGAIFATGVLCVLTTPEYIEYAERCIITYYAAKTDLYNVLGVAIPFDYYTNTVYKGAKSADSQPIKNSINAPQSVNRVFPINHMEQKTQINASDSVINHLLHISQNWNVATDGIYHKVNILRKTFGLTPNRGKQYAAASKLFDALKDRNLV